MFASASRERLMCLMLGAAEVAWALVRARNIGRLTPDDFTDAMATLRSEVVDATDFKTLPCGTATVVASIDLVDPHSLGSADAIVLRTALDVAAELRADSDDLILVAADERLIQAAQAQGLQTFSPETDSQDALDAFLAEPQEEQM